ncbi:MAG: hypothetical protein HRF45_10075 [Fimbriimonadia bacterium]|jgi:hypothetical protein
MIEVCLLAAFSPIVAEPVEIVRSFRQGEKASYVVIRKQKDADAVMKGSGGTWRVDLEVLSVHPDETRLQLTRTTVKLDAEGSPALSDDVLQQMKRSSQVQVLVRKDGKLEVTGDTAAPGGFEASMQWYRDVMLAALPPKPVEPGDAWDEPYPADLSPALRPVGTPKISYKFEGIEDLADKPTLKVGAVAAFEQVSDAGLGNEGPKIDLRIRRELRYTMWLRPADGRLLKNTGTETLTLESTSSELPFRHSFTMTLEVLPLEPKRSMRLLLVPMAAVVCWD